MEHQLWNLFHTYANSPKGRVCKIEELLWNYWNRLSLFLFMFNQWHYFSFGIRGKTVFTKSSLKKVCHSLKLFILNLLEFFLNFFFLKYHWFTPPPSDTGGLVFNQWHQTQGGWCLIFGIMTRKSELHSSSLI